MRYLFGVLVVALALAGSGCAGPQTFTLVAEFANVGDLVPRANVQSSDAVVGTITSIDLDQERDWRAVVTMRLEPGTPIPVGSTAVVRSTSLLGEKFVDIAAPPNATAATPTMSDGDVIPLDRTGKAPELEDAFVELGALLASGALQDLSALITASAAIVEGQEENLGRVFDGTAALMSSLASQREALGEALELLNSTAGTFAGGTDTINRFLSTTDDVLRILAEQRARIDEVVVNLDRLGGTSARLMQNHKQDMDRQIKALLEIIPALHEGRGALDQSLAKLPRFADLFTRAIPGDYVQLDILLEDPLALPVPASGEAAVSSILWEATR